MIKFINKKYRDRHRILQVLQERYDDIYSPNIHEGELELNFSQLIDYCKLTEGEVLEQIDYLHKEGEISIDEIQFSNYYIILRNGTISYYDKKYLNVGKQEFLNNLYDILKIFSTIVLLTIAIVTFLMNTFATIKLTNEVSRLSDEIKVLKDKK